MTHKLFSMVKKNAIVMIALVGMGALTMFSCSKKGSSSPYTMSATATSSTGTATPVSVSGQSVVYAVITPTGTGNTMLLMGESIGGGDTTGFSFTVVNYTGAGTYALADSINANLGDYVYANGTTHIDDVASSGSLVVSSVSSTQMTGTFSFTGVLGTHISNGAFTAIIVP